MIRGRKWFALLLACGMTLGGASCAGNQAQAGANDPAIEGYQATITSSMQGETIALLDGDIGHFAANYTKGCAKNYVEEDATKEELMVDRFAPKPATIAWENSRDGTLYYTVRVGLKADLSDAESYLVSDTSIDIEYLFAAKHYYYQIYAHYENDEVVKSRIFDFYTANLPRTVYIEGVSNTRDIGGRFVQNGKYQVKQGMVYRGAEVDNAWGKITEEGKRVMLYELGIKTDLDLRNNSENSSTVSPLGPSVNYVAVGGKGAPHYVSEEHGIDSKAYKEALIKEIRAFANPDNYPIYLHCSLGRDRAGTLAYLISALIGVEEIDLYRDYEISLFSVTGWADAAQGVGQHDNLMNAIGNLNRYIKYYGNGSIADNAEKFVKELGITQEEVDAIRNILLEEVTA